MARAGRSVLVVTVVVGVLLFATGAAGLLWLAREVQDSLSEDVFHPGAMTKGEVEKLFSVTLPATTVYSRSLGFQDPYLDVLVRVPDGAAFATANHFTLGPSTEDVTAADAAVRKLGSPRGAVKVSALEGMSDVPGPGDAGYVEWFRHGVVMQYEDQVWVYLVAYGT